jgi:arsenite-transporting ATPase
VISTDPAHSLGDALGVKLSREVSRIETRRGSLSAVELDADRALTRWLAPRRRALEEAASRGTYLDDDDLERVFRLSLPGVDELVGLLEVSRLAREKSWDDVVIDTAPTGHTLRFFQMPRTLRRIASVFDDMAAKHRLLAESLGGRYRRDRVDEVIEEIDREGRELSELLIAEGRAEVMWILLPERLSLEEARDGVGALRRAGMRVAGLVVNRLTPAPTEPCARCGEKVRAERKVLSELLRRTASRKADEALADLEVRIVPRADAEPRGLPELRSFSRALLAEDRGASWLRAKLPSESPAKRRPRTAPTKIAETIVGHAKLVLFGGKGGVGKTTCAAATAIAFTGAHPGARVLLLSVDPAHSFGDVLAVSIGDEPRRLPAGPASLLVRELDAEHAFEAQRERYEKAVDELFDRLRGGSRFDAVHDRAIVHDLLDLAPPGIDEIFALLSILDALVPENGGRAPFDLVVLDTAPTGHALRLLALPAPALEWTHTLLGILLKYKSAVGLGELARDLLALAKQLKALEAILHDATSARFVVVTRAAELPMRETERLFSALAKAHISAPVMLVNARVPPGCSRCEAERAKETRALEAHRPPRGAKYVTVTTREEATPPRGLRELLAFEKTWEIT